MKYANEIKEILSEEYTNINFVSEGDYINITATNDYTDEVENLRAELFYSEPLESDGVTIEFYNNGWRELTTWHFDF